MVKIRTHLLALFLLATLAVAARAEVASPDVLKQIEAAKKEFKPFGAPGDVAKSRYQAQYKLYELDKYLYASGSKNRAAWKQFLNWEALTAELNKPTPDSLVLADIVNNNFKENEKGLEQGPFTRARDAVAGAFGILRRPQALFQE